MELLNKKILFLVPVLGGGGAERVTALLCNDFFNRGMDVSILETERHRNDYANQPKYPVHSLGINSTSAFAVLQRAYRLKSYLKKNKPDIIISLGCAFKYLSLLKSYQQSDLVLSERNYPKAIYSDLEFKAVEKLFSKSKKIVFQTPDAKQCFSPLVQNVSTIIANPIIEVPKSKHVKSKRIVTCCRLHPQKNLTMLLKAFALFSKSHNGYSLSIYGDGPLHDDLIALAKELKISSSVSILPYTKDIHAEIQNAELFVSTSDYEGLQNALMEAMAMGIPTIATDCLGGGARYITDNGRRGLLIPARDEKKLAEAMGKVLDNPLLADSLSTQGQEIRSLFSIENICSQWYEYLIS